MLTNHKIIFGDAKEIIHDNLPNESIQLMVTSPPYWNVRDYGHPEQIGYGDTIEEYLNRLDGVWREVVRVLIPDGKIALNIGNIYYSEPDEKRRTTANISLLAWQRLTRLKKLRFMGTIYWQKTTSRAGAVLFGSYPYPTNFMISNAVEPIFIFRKIGQRTVTEDIKKRSRVSREEFRTFRDAIWNVNGAASDKHTAAFPLEIPRRLIKMFSYVEDTILDPFLGSATTTKAAIELGRNSIGIEIQHNYLRYMKEKIEINERTQPFEAVRTARIEVHDGSRGTKTYYLADV